MNKLNDIEVKLITEATAKIGNSYAPYSNIHVSAALQASDGKIYTGCNIENVAYGSTMCAERTAIFKMISEGSKCWKELALVTDAAIDVLWPCGACLQVMKETAESPESLVTFSMNGEFKTFMLKELIKM